MFKEGAELEFDSKDVIIKGMGGRSKTRYRTTDPSMIVVAPDKRPNLPTVEVEFTLTEDDFNWILRCSNVLGSPNIGIESNGDVVSLTTFDVSDNSVHTNSVVLENVNANGQSYKLIFKSENLKMLPGTYNVEISSKGIAKFVGESNGLVYYVTLETSSVYGV